MKRLLLLVTVILILSGCVVYPGYDYGYYGGYYGPAYEPYPYGYVVPNVSIGITSFHGGHHFHHGGFHGGRR